MLTGHVLSDYWGVYEPFSVPTASVLNQATILFQVRFFLSSAFARICVSVAQTAPGNRVASFVWRLLDDYRHPYGHGQAREAEFLSSELVATCDACGPGNTTLETRAVTVALGAVSVPATTDFRADDILFHLMDFQTATGAPAYLVNSNLPLGVVTGPGGIVYDWQFAAYDVRA